MLSGQRICSLLPSATEIVYVLGLQDRLVAVTHECDYPLAANSKPHITSSVIDSEGLSSREIDEAVRESLASQATIYYIDGALLQKLQPDLILTQELCEVCAVGPDIVKRAASVLDYDLQMVSLEPHTLQGVLESVLHVGRLTGVEDRAVEVVDGLRFRLDRVGEALSGVSRRPVLTLEWLDPPFIGGHWVPEMVELAGGRDVLGTAGTSSREVTWAEIEATQPEVIIAMPCGFGMERSATELARAPLPDFWPRLPAVRSGEVYVVDGSSYFNRPGPRLVDGVEILASILHPEPWSSAPPDSYRVFTESATSRS